MNPIGRQSASGLSLLLSASRCFCSSAAHGRSGTGSLSPYLMFQNTVMITGIVPSPRGEPPVPDTLSVRGNVMTFCQRPDRSGLPSAVLGVGAVRFGLPSAVRGTPGVGNDGHCAASDADAMVRSRKTNGMRSGRFMATILPSRHEERKQENWVATVSATRFQLPDTFSDRSSQLS